MHPKLKTEYRAAAFLGALTLLFAGLKLAGIITWSWWWVTSPLWCGFLLWFMLVMVVIAVFLARR